MNNVNSDTLMHICMGSSSKFILNDHRLFILTRYMPLIVLNTGDTSQVQQLVVAAECSAGITANPIKGER